MAVVGGGVAGMACALRLAQRGYEVTLYESAPMLGGNASSERSSRGPYYDVYPHLYPEWYANFWKLCKDDLNMTRQDAFHAANRNQDLAGAARAFRRCRCSNRRNAGAQAHLSGAEESDDPAGHV